MRKIFRVVFEHVDISPHAFTICDFNFVLCLKGAVPTAGFYVGIPKNDNGRVTMYE